MSWTSKYRRMLRKIGYSANHASASAFPYVDESFWDIYERNSHITRLPWQVLYDAYLAAKHVTQNGIEGDVVECGVWRGGSAISMAETLGGHGDDHRRVFMYDTYEGMSEPTELDVRISDGASAVTKYQDRRRGDHSDWQYASLREVQANVASARYPRNRFVLVKGKVEDTIPGKIALLRLDTDFYNSTSHEMEHLYPRLSAGGVLIIDDYGAWAGARKAVDDYVASKSIRMLLLQNTVNGAAIGVKVE
jgi:O-methyltransferase